MILAVLAVGLIAYLLGSINFAVIIGNHYLKKDVRKLGSGNAGATNVLRNAGFFPGILTFLADALKGLVAALIGRELFVLAIARSAAAWADPVYGAYLGGIFCMLGHIFPLFFHFKGGKGVAICVGIFAISCPKAMIVGLSVFALCLLLSRIVSLSSLLATVTVVTCSAIFAKQGVPVLPQILMSAVMGLIIFIKHRDNIKRLIHGTESRIGGKKNA